MELFLFFFLSCKQKIASVVIEDASILKSGDLINVLTSIEERYLGDLKSQNIDVSFADILESDQFVKETTELMEFVKSKGLSDSVPALVFNGQFLASDDCLEYLFPLMRQVYACATLLI